MAVRISRALRSACEDLGVDIRTGAAVQQISVANGATSSQRSLFTLIPTLRVAEANYNTSQLGKLPDRLWGDRVTELIGQFAPNMPGSVIARRVYTPLDLEQTFGITEGNFFHGDI